MPTSPASPTEAPAPSVPVATIPAIPLPPLNVPYVHHTSGNMYAVTVAADDSITYVRYGDGKSFELSPTAFLLKFRAASAIEVDNLRRALPTLRTSRAAASPANIQRAIAVVAAGGVVPAAPAPAAATPVEASPAAPATAQESAENPATLPDADSGQVQIEPNPRRRARPEDEPVGVLIEPTENDSFERIVTYPECTASIQAGVRSIQNRAALNVRFGMGRIQPMEGRCVINFFGKPGTGKTLSAKAIAFLLGKKLYVVDYAAVISKYVGDTAKHIKAAFAQAAELDAILFFDEADSLFSKRVGMGDHDQSFATSINQNRNVLMQELDRFNGIVIAATNALKNFDPAIMRRIAKHVEFKLPNRAMRKAILDLHFPVKDFVQIADFNRVAAATLGFSGGDILNVALNSMEAAALDENPDVWFITESIVFAEVMKIHATKEAHVNSKERDGVRKRMAKAVTIINAPAMVAIADEDDADDAADLAAPASIGCPMGHGMLMETAVSDDAVVS